MVMLNEIFVSFLQTGKFVLHADYKVIDALHLLSKIWYHQVTLRKLNPDLIPKQLLPWQPDGYGGMWGLILHWEIMSVNVLWTKCCSFCWGHPHRSIKESPAIFHLQWLSYWLFFCITDNRLLFGRMFVVMLLSAKFPRRV